MQQDHKVALVTGASRGIGAAVARCLARDGFTLAVHYGTSRSEADAVVSAIEGEGGSAFSIQAELARPQEIGTLFDKAFDHRGRLDVVVHNAGVQLLGSQAEMDAFSLDQVVAVNLTAAFHVLGHAARRVADGGRIIALSSGTTAVLPPRYGIYAATKAGVEALVGTLATELRGRGVTVSSPHRVVRAVS